MNIEKRLQEIKNRQIEIRSLLDGEQDVNVEDLTTEVEALNTEKRAIASKLEVAGKIDSGELEVRTLEKPKGEKEVEKRNLTWNEAIETQEYRTAWIKENMGMSLSAEERSFMDKVNEEYRAFTHTTENTAVLIPKTVAAGIWERASEVSSLWADVRKFFVRGELSLVKGDRDSGSDAEWYVEADEVDSKELAFGTLNLTGCELARDIQVTWKLRKMAIPEFEAYIIAEIGYKMGKALSYGVYSGKGKPGVGDTFKPEPLGIKTALANEASTPQFVEYTADAMEFKNLTSSMASLHSSYAGGATIYANNKTIWNVLANVVDTNGKSLFVTDVSAGGVGRVFGLNVKMDDAIPEGEILFGNLNRGYVMNINEDVTMHRDEQMKKRLTDYMGYAIVDGAPIDNQAFVILQEAVVAG